MEQQARAGRAAPQPGYEQEQLLRPYGARWIDPRNANNRRRLHVAGRWREYRPGVHLRKGRCRCLARQRGALQEYHEQALYGNGRCPRRQLLDPGVRQTPKVAAPRRSLHEASLHREAFFMCAIFNKFPKKGWIEGAVGLL